MMQFSPGSHMSSDDQGDKPFSTGSDNSSVLSAGAFSNRRVITSTALLGGCRELLILHEGEEYRLRLTSNSKLILTK